MKANPFEMIVAHFGSVQAAALALGCTTQAVYNWKRGVPRMRALQVEAMTQGRLKAVDLVRAA